MRTVPVRGGRTARQAFALALGTWLALAGCQPTPPATVPAPTAGPPTATPTVAGTPGASPTSMVGTAPGDALRDAVDEADILADLQRLEAITDEHGGTRPAGSEAYDAAVAFVAEELQRAGLTVTLQPVELPYFRQDAPSRLEIAADGAAVFEDVRDFKAMLFSASGDVTAKVVALGYDPNAQPGDANGPGCDPSDWAGVPRDVIVLLQPARCRRHDVVVQAQAAGALAVVTSYASWSRDGVLRPTLLEPDDIRIPVLGATRAVGDSLAQAARNGAQVHLVVDTTIETRQSMNVIAETAGGDPGHVVMLGGHFDSVVDGPGINDNGSGTMAILEIAREVARLTAGDGGGGGAVQAPWKVRVAFWTGEELGFFGSSAYVRGLGPAAIGIQAYLNFDMLGSKNGLRLVYDAAGTSRPTEATVLAGLFGQALDADDLAWETEGFLGASDQSPFDQAGIPTGGLFSGANERKSADQAERFGGLADAPADACYHLACDTLDNVDPVLLAQMTRAAAWVTGSLASGEVDLTSP